MKDKKLGIRTVCVFFLLLFVGLDTFVIIYNYILFRLIVKYIVLTVHFGGNFKLIIIISIFVSI